MKFIKGTKIITVKGTSKRVTHKRKIKVSDKKEDIKKEIISLDYQESVNNIDNYMSLLNQNDEGKKVLESIKGYTQMGYIGINEYLKRGKTIYFNSITEHDIDNTKKIISNIKDFLNNAPKYHGKIYRGVTYMMNSDKDIKKWDDLINNIENSEIITFSSFLSCSKSEKIANIFTNNYQKYSGKFNSCLMIIKTKSGVPIEKISTSNEKEILLNFDKNYKISKCDKSNPNKIKLYLEEI
jgi:hypothetical protein